MTWSEGAAADGLQQAVDGLAARLGRSVAVDDTRGHLVVSSRHFGDEDPLRVHAVMQRSSDDRVLAHFAVHDIHRWTGPGRIPADTELGFKARVCCPVRCHGIPFGHLFLIDDGVDEPEVELAAAAADEIGRLMYDRLVLHEQRHGRREALARDLVSDDAATRESARRSLLDEHLVAGLEPLVAISVRLLDADTARSAAPETVLRVAFERLAQGSRGNRTLTTATGRRGTVLLTGDAATVETAGSVGRELVGELGRADGVARVVVGIGGVAPGVDAARPSRDEADVGVDAALLLPGIGDVVSYEDLGVHAVLLAIPRRHLTAGLLPPGLRRLLAHDAADGLADTLETYLDCGGDATRTATRLRVHRSTLYYRLDRITSITGLDLHDGEARLALHVGLKLQRLITATVDTTSSHF